MDESSVVMKAAVPERASTTHLFARSARSTGVARSDVRVRLARGGLGAERGGDDESNMGRRAVDRSAPHIPASASLTGAAASRLIHPLSLLPVGRFALCVLHLFHLAQLKLI